MMDLENIKPPASLDWQSWIKRWDRMQERYLVKRNERFEIIVRAIKATQSTVTRVLDLGCGTGSLMVPVLESFLAATVIGIDFDPTILWLAKARLDHFGERSIINLADMRDPSWINLIDSPVDAVISATALHWFSPEQLAGLYNQLSQILKSGGIFLNADHVGAAMPSIQTEWENHRVEMRKAEGTNQGEDWDGFWNGYSQDLGLNIEKVHQMIIGGWEGGVENGLPLSWHFDRLRDSGFSKVDCLWRCDCDAIYAAIKA